MVHEIQQSKLSDYGVYSSYMKSDAPRMIRIAPAPEIKYSDAHSNMEQKKYNYKSNPYTGAQAASIARRNARERNRVKQVNDGFNALRKRLPAAVIAALSGGARRGSGKKLSKVDTLKMVVEYIKHLQQILDESDAALGIKRDMETSAVTSMPFEMDEGIFAGRSSPYSESVPSPAASECSSGVSSSYSSGNGYVPNYQTVTEQLSPMEEDDLLDAITWWQQK
ncbi:achaete-scute complex protein T3-like [Choristoneura fumiferana]|uniref:achaete-scute complex protein T3-like n=1 Tax=Choristoneura fumiferana TaxID=7141 RepID=UPI003D155C65